MLTRLKVSGFKSLVDVDIRFGPFTCIAGANGVGKSNLFDAIQFLSALADNTLLEAALSIRRSGKGHAYDVRSLFHHTGGQENNTMSFEAEMIIPSEGVDDLRQRAEASITFLRYKVVISYEDSDNLLSIGSLKLSEENLEHINVGEAHRHLRFPHSARNWRNSAVHGRRTSGFISTIDADTGPKIMLHQDQSGGRPKTFLARSLPRTVLSTVSATENPTALLARREMQSWRLLQLEPSALREPDEFTASPGLGADGSHLPITLYYLARLRSQEQTQTWLYEQVANRLSELIDDVYDVAIDRDEKRQLLSLKVTDTNQTTHPARSLSDGTLRFLALAVLEQDPSAGGLICLEEPENGIHPKRIPAMLRLLEDIAVDVNEPVTADNPLRQVIINTHSPLVVQCVADDSLLVAELKEVVGINGRSKTTHFAWLPDTWREKAAPHLPPIAKGKVIDYLNQPFNLSEGTPDLTLDNKKTRRVGERADLQLPLPLPH